MCGGRNGRKSGRCRGDDRAFMAHSGRTWHKRNMTYLYAMMVLAAATAGPPTATAADEAALQCFTARETSERVARLRLFNPLMAMRATARRIKADPLRTRLCRNGPRLVYELSLIRRDGKVQKVYLNAQNGAPVKMTP